MIHPPSLSWTTSCLLWPRLASSSMPLSASLVHSSNWATISQHSWHLWQHWHKPHCRQSSFLMHLAGMYFFLDQMNYFYIIIFYRFAYCAEQVKRKPGREVVTFLLVCNLAMWAINTLETNRADSHPIQVSKGQINNNSCIAIIIIYYINPI